MLYSKAEDKIKSKKTGKYSRFSVVFTVFLILLAVAIGIYMGEYAKFNPINGTFQNYNPVRRLLNGQIPYKDFQDYLGFGHLYLGSLATILTGGTYRGSLIAFTVLTVFSTASIFLVLGRSIAGKKHMLFFTALCVLIFLAWQGIDKIRPAFPGTAPSAFSVGNSTRMLRASVLPLSAALLIRLKDFAGIKSLCFYALISAVAFLWCNDYGISCWICIAVMLFLLMLSRREKFLKAVLYTALELLLSVLFIIVLVEVFTLGNFSAWFKSTFGTGGYQSWYYNSLKSHYLYDLDFSVAVIIQALLCVYYIVRMIIGRGSETAYVRFGVPAYFNMVCFCAANEYKLLSGGYLWEACEIVMGTTLIAEVFCFIISRCNGRSVCLKLYVVIKSIIAAAVVLASVAFFIAGTGGKQGTYVPQLGGYNIELGDDLLRTSGFINGRNFFATYASGQEVVENSFQPSGTDYIIHVLGDNHREDYLDSFRNCDADLAATINHEYSFYEFWVRRANWFFYRELYAGWHPVYSNTYETYWEKNSLSDSSVFSGEVSLEIEDVTPSVKKIIILTDEHVNGVADVFVDWSVERKEGASLFLFNPMLYLRDTGSTFAYDRSQAFAVPYFDTNWLRAESAEFIPVTVINGYGEAVLTSFPEKDTVLVVRRADCSSILPVRFNYLHISDASVSEEGDVVFSALFTPENAAIAENASQIGLGGERFAVISSESDSMIRITVDSRNIDMICSILENNNMAFCIKEESDE